MTQTMAVQPPQMMVCQPPPMMGCVVPMPMCMPQPMCMPPMMPPPCGPCGAPPMHVVSRGPYPGDYHRDMRQLQMHHVHHFHEGGSPGVRSLFDEHRPNYGYVRTGNVA